MISIVVYGRNDAHGYNLHRRVALSLNSLAESLTQDDEIIFVDWNTPHGLPPLPHAIRDTLSPKVWDLLRILSVSPEIHASLVRDGSSKVVIEPVARNVGARRANSRNSWLLATNTDVLIATQNRGISEVVRDLPPGYYGSPRFELPEWLWETLSRSEPSLVQEQVESWLFGTLPTTIVESYAFSLFDGCGDFQLTDRASFMAVGGFDETMVLGWHVDSNFARRMHLYHGVLRSLASHVRILHSNHNRSTTHYFGGSSTSNSIAEYVFGDVPMVARSGIETWGLPDADIPETRLAQVEHRALRTRSAIQTSGWRPSASSHSTSTSRLAGVPAEVTVPFILDRILSDAIDRVIYLGNRSRMLAVLGQACAAAGVAVDTESPDYVAHSDRRLVVVDLTPSSPDGATSLALLPNDQKLALRRVLDALANEVEDEISGSRTPRVYALINVEGNEFSPLSDRLFDILPPQYYARLRLGTLKASMRTHRLPRPSVFRRLLSSVVAFLLQHGAIEYWRRFRSWILGEAHLFSPESKWPPRLQFLVPFVPPTKRALTPLVLSHRKSRIMSYTTTMSRVPIPLALSELNGD